MKTLVNQEPSHHFADVFVYSFQSDSANRDYLKVSLSTYVDKIQKLAIPSF